MPVSHHSNRTESVSADEIPLAIQWHEGMLLAPQHFQELARRQEALLQYRASVASPFLWGVRRLEIDKNHLTDGRFSVIDLEAVMPDGLLLVSQPDGAPLSVELKPHIKAMTRAPVTIYLAVAARQRGRAIANGALARYDSIEGDAVPDANTGDGVLRVPRLVPRPRLIASEMPPRQYVSLPLAKVIYQNEAFELTDFIPPSLHVPLQSPLGELCLSITTRLRSKAITLAEQVRVPSDALSDTQRLEMRQTVHHLVAALPQLEAVLYSSDAHPYGLYLALCALAGQVSSLTDALVPPVFERYNHEDPRASFERVCTYISIALDQGIIDSYTPIRFNRKDHLFYLLFEPEWAERELIVGVRARDGVTPENMKKWVDGCFIAGSNQIQALWQKRIKGVKRHPVSASRNLMPRPGVTLYSLTFDPSLIEVHEYLQIVNPNDPEGKCEPVEIILYVGKTPRRAEE